MKKIIILLLIIQMMLGCASPTIKASSKMKVNNIGIVAVLPFSGINAEQFSDSISQELMLKNIQVVERGQIHAVLAEQGLNISQLSSSKIDYKKLGGLLGADHLVAGSVSPIIVYASGAPSGKVSTASIRIISVSNGIIVASGTYNANTDLLAGSVLYPKAAEKLVNAVIE